MLIRDNIALERAGQTQANNKEGLLADKVPNLYNLLASLDYSNTKVKEEEEEDKDKPQLSQEP